MIKKMYNLIIKNDSKKDCFKNIIYEIAFVIFSFGLTLFALSSAITVCDYWWHVKAGEYMVQTNQVAKTGIYSWFAEDLSWTSHEWLSEIVLYLFDSKLGYFGGYLFTFIFVFLLLSLIYLTNRKILKEHFSFSIFWLILGIITLIPVSMPRPHLISFILLAFTIYILEQLRLNESSKFIWILPFIAIAWSNFHGGSSNLVYILPIIYIVGGLFEGELMRISFHRLTKRQFMKYFIAVVLGIIGITLNPHGYDMLLYPYVNAADSFMFQTISEWRSFDFKNLYDIMIGMPFILSILIILISKKNIDFIDFLLIGAFSYLTLRSMRFIIFFYIVITPILFKYLYKKNHLNKKHYGIWFMISIASLIIGISINPLLSEEKVFLNEPFPKEFIEEIKKVNPERLYNHYNLGSYLIYNDIEVFIDGRADMYSKYNYKDNYNLSNLIDDPTKIIEKYNFDAYLVLKSSPFYKYLLTQDNLHIQLENEELAFLIEKK